jgi:hypothetical protein
MVMNNLMKLEVMMDITSLLVLLISLGRHGSGDVDWLRIRRRRS